MAPLISIIMPCHNAAEHLPRSIGSVLAQTIPLWELIAVDDGSTDDTLTHLRSLADPRIHPYTQPNHGVSRARNLALSKASGRYVAFLDADDTWHPNFLETMTAALEVRPEAVLAYCGWQKVGLTGDRGLPFVPPDYENKDKARILFQGCRWPIHAAVAQTNAVLAAGGFDPTLKNAEDYALWLRIATVAPIVRVPEVLAMYHFHGGVQASSQKARAALHHLIAQQRFLAEHPQFIAAIGAKRAHDLMLGELLNRGYACYWERDLTAARQIFRVVMRHGYGTLRDWGRMLPAWLPQSWHAGLTSINDACRPGRK